MPRRSKHHPERLNPPSSKGFWPSVCAVTNLNLNMNCLMHLSRFLASFNCHTEIILRGDGSFSLQKSCITPSLMDTLYLLLIFFSGPFYILYISLIYMVQCSLSIFTCARGLILLVNFFVWPCIA